MPYSLIVALIFGSFAMSAQAQSSIELMCRNQAKEIAAEAYKNCVTENKQVQIEKIRKEYQAKLGELKSHYDQELKKLSSQNKNSGETAVRGSANKASQKRASGARALPEKTIQVKTEAIDLTTESSTTEPSEKTVSDSNVEIVEIPTE